MISLSVIIPTYNADAFIGGVLERLRTWLLSHEEIELIVVDDGSTDTTLSILRGLETKIPRLRIISIPSNKGKGFALRSGFAEAVGEYLAFTDADLPYGLSVFERMLEAMKKDSDLCLLYGSRSHELSKEEKGYGTIRRFGRNFFSNVIRFIAVPDVEDTQCGIKMLNRPLALEAIKVSKINRFAFDIELFMITKAHMWRYNSFPVELNHRKESSVRLVRDTIVMLRDVVSISRRHKRGDYV